MRAAGEEIRECYRVLEKGGTNLVAEILRGQGTFYEDDHYPEGDVFDSDTASQYYYHAHRGLPGEHGHFHTFRRHAAIPDGMTPVPYEGDEPWPEGEDTVVHLAGISMDRYGYPIGLFVTNRWVTGETWFSGPDTAALARGFEIDHAFPSWPTNRWLGAMFRLFTPQIEGLLRQRDQVVHRWSALHPGVDVYEDRELDITGWLKISVDAQIARLEAALRAAA